MNDIFLSAKDITTSEINKSVGEVIKIPGKGLFKFDGKKWNKVDVVSELVDNYIPYGNEGQISYIKNDGYSVRINDWLVKLGNFVDDPDLFEQIINSTVDQSVIFNSWYRFSHDASGNFPANSDELNAWKLNDDGNISCTVNSNTYVGFVSSKEYDYYELEVTLSSTAADNDRMGVVLAFYKDPKTGKEHTLSAIRNNDSNNYSWFVAYNFFQFSSEFGSDSVLINKSNIIPRCNPDNWNNYNPGTVIKVKRDGNHFKVWTSKCGETTIDENSLIEFNLDDYPELKIFKGPKPYGFSARSQDATTFSNIVFKNTSPIAIDKYVFDIKNNKVYDKDVDDYIDSDVFSIIGKGRIIKDINTGKMWFLSPTKEFVLLTSVDDVERYYFSKIEVLEILRNLLKYSIKADATEEGIDTLINNLISSVNSGEI